MSNELIYHRLLIANFFVKRVSIIRAKTSQYEFYKKAVQIVYENNGSASTARDETTVARWYYALLFHRNENEDASY